MPVRLNLVAVLLGMMPAVSLASDDPSDVKQFENRPGWSWIINPVPNQSDAGFPQMEIGHGLVLLVEEGKDNELVVVVAHPGAGQPIDGFYTWQPIAFNDHGHRVDLRPLIAMGSRVAEQDHWVFMSRYGSDPRSLPESKVSHVGLEGMTIEGLKLWAEEAAQKLREKGIDPLPFPSVGEPYTFQFTSADGEMIDSQDLKGKVVLLDCWATWCLPCMEKMPELKKLYAQWHDQGFEVVGINFDKDNTACLEAVGELKLPWKQTMAPADDKLRDLWLRAIGRSSLPRLLLIDRKGNLHADCAPSELEKHVTDLMQDTGEDGR